MEAKHNALTKKIRPSGDSQGHRSYVHSVTIKDGKKTNHLKMRRESREERNPHLSSSPYN